MSMRLAADDADALPERYSVADQITGSPVSPACDLYPRADVAEAASPEAVATCLRWIAIRLAEMIVGGNATTAITERGSGDVPWTHIAPVHDAPPRRLHDYRQGVRTRPPATESSYPWVVFGANPSGLGSVRLVSSAISARHPSVISSTISCRATERSRTRCGSGSPRSPTRVA